MSVSDRRVGRGRANFVLMAPVWIGLAVAAAGGCGSNSPDGPAIVNVYEVKGKELLSDG